MNPDNWAVRPLSDRESVVMMLEAEGWSTCDDGVGIVMQIDNGPECIAMLQNVTTDDDGFVYATFGVTVVSDHELTRAEHAAIRGYDAGRPSVFDISTETDGGNVRICIVYDVFLVPDVSPHELFLKCVWLPFTEFLTLFREYDNLHPQVRWLFCFDQTVADMQ